MTLGDRLRELRSSVGLSGRGLGFLADISESYPTLIESGKRPNVDSGVVAKLAKVLGCSTDYLILGVDGPPPREEILAAAIQAKTEYEARQAAKGLHAVEVELDVGSHQSGEHPAAAEAPTGTEDEGV